MEFVKSRYEEYEWNLVQFKRVRSVYALSRWGEPELYVKIYHPDTASQKLRNLASPKTLKEMRTLLKLKQAGVTVPEVVEHLRNGTVSALVTRAVHPSTQLAMLPEHRQMRYLIGMAVTLLEKGFYYKDCHAGNVILDGSGEPVLVDAYAVVPVKAVTEGLVVGLFSQIASAYRVPDALMEEKIRGLLPGADPSTVMEEIREKGLLARRRLVARRVARSLREGSFSQEVSTDSYTAYVSREHPVDLERVVLEHARNLSERTRILKFQNKTQLSAVGDLCVKSYARPKPLMEPYALRSWKGLLTLRFNKLPVAEPVAVVLGRDGTSILITGLVLERDLNRVLFHEYPTMPLKLKLDMARELARLLATMHGLYIYHADLKASNIKFRKNPVSFVFLDTDRVVQGTGIARDKRLRNLAQINNSIPRHVKKTVRMAFLHAYADMTGDDPRELFRDVWELSRDETIAYRTDDGDRSESWKN